MERVLLEKHETTQEAHNILVVRGTSNESHIDSIVDALTHHIHGEEFVVDVTEKSQVEEKSSRAFYDVAIFPYTGFPDNGSEIVRVLQENSPDTKLFATTHDYDEDLELRLMGEGVYSIMSNPIRPTRLGLTVRNAINQTKLYRDPKTGLYTMHMAQERIGSEIGTITGQRGNPYGVNLNNSRGSSRRNFESISLMMVDFDDFKHINEKYGHITGGDAALKTVSDLFKSIARPTDTLARYGGDEICGGFPGLPYDSALRRAEIFRQSVEKADILSGDGRKMPVKVTVGVAYFPDESIEPSASGLIGAADKALMFGKHHLGKNQVFGFGELDPQYK